MKTSTGSRLAAVALLIGVAVLAYRGEESPLLAQDPSLPSEGARVKVNTRCRASHVTYYGTTGGKIQTNKAGVNAWVFKPPGLPHQCYRRRTAPGRFWLGVQGQKRPCLSTLPNGKWVADDGKGGTKPPTLRFAKAKKGQYDIWVGTDKGVSKQVPGVELHYQWDNPSGSGCVQRAGWLDLLSLRPQLHRVTPCLFKSHARPVGCTGRFPTSSPVTRSSASAVACSSSLGQQRLLPRHARVVWDRKSRAAAANRRTEYSGCFPSRSGPAAIVGPDRNQNRPGRSRGVGTKIAIAVLLIGLVAGAGAGFWYRDDVFAWLGVAQPASPDAPGATDRTAALPVSEQPAAPKRVKKPAGVAMALDSGGHTAEVNQILFTPDGREIITVSDDCTIRVWSTLTGESVRVLRPPVGRRAGEGELKAAALAPDGGLLAVTYYGTDAPANSGDEDRAERTGTILLIALEAGRIERVLKQHTDNVNHLAFSPDGKWLASSALDFSVRLWDVGSGKSVHELKGTVLVSGLAFSPDSRRLAVVREPQKEVVLWQMATGQKDTVPLLKGPNPTCVAWSPDNKTIAVGSGPRKKSITLLNADGTLRSRLPGPPGRINALVFARDSQTLLVTGFGNYCALLGLDGKERVRFKGHTGKVATGEANIRAGALAPDGALAVTGGMPEEVFVWRTADATVVHRLTGKGGSAVTVGWSPDGKTLAWGYTRDPGATDLNRQGPLERTFSLTDLELGGPPDVPFLQARTVLGQRSLEQTTHAQVAPLKEGNDPHRQAQLGGIYRPGQAKQKARKQARVFHPDPRRPGRARRQSYHRVPREGR